MTVHVDELRAVARSGRPGSRHTALRSPARAAAERLLQPKPQPRWTAQAACSSYDPDAWFAGPGRADLVRMAKQICAGCPVRGDCLEHALASRELAFGIWGGLTAAERRALVRSRTAAA